MPNAETFFRPLLRGPLDTVVGGTNAFANRTALNSGSVTVTVSTSVVNSDSLIFSTVQASAVTSSAAGNVDVTSVVPGVSFCFTRHNGVAAPFGSTIMWMIMAPK